MYIDNKMEHISNKSECHVHRHTRIETFQRRTGRATGLQTKDFVLTKKLKNKTISNLNNIVCVAM